MERNPELRTAWEFVENTGRSIFLTGKAGTGKTTFLKTVVERSRKRPIVVAPTGVAAMNAGGVTIHSFFQLPLSPYIPGTQREERYDFSKQKRQLIASVDLLIIDEISMVRADLLDAIDNVLRRYRDHTKPFGGVQLLMIGDLAQLTPVVTPKEEQLLRNCYDTPYFFGSHALQQTDYVTIQLEKVYRQQDAAFLDILNDIRHGNPSAHTLELLRQRCVQPPAGLSFIRLTTHNQLADHYNESHLASLSGKLFWFNAQVDGTFPEYLFPTAATMVLKVGAQVMFIKNDPSGRHRYYNGRIGHVTYVDQNKVLVLCEGDAEPIEVEPLQWENARYTINPETRAIETDVQGTFRQLPLRLAWAITIHKSQGLTFDHVVIDAAQSFAPGQVYVALSRCRTLEGLFLATPIEPRAVINDQRVEGYIAHQEQAAQESIAKLPLLRQEYERHLLLQLFDFSSLFQAEESMVRLMAEFFMRTHSDLMQLHNQTYAALRQQVMEVAQKWTAQIRTMPTEGLRQTAFLDRVKRSAAYFAQHIDALLMKPINLSAAITSNNNRAKNRLADVLPQLRQQWYVHHTLLGKMAATDFNVTTYLKERQMAMLDAADDQALRRLLKPKKERTIDVTLRLFKENMTPKQIADERSISINTVINHLAQLVGEGQLKIEQVIAPERREKIEKVVRAVGLDNGLTPIKNLCPEDVGWEELRMVVANMTAKND